MKTSTSSILTFDLKKHGRANINSNRIIGMHLLRFKNYFPLKAVINVYWDTFHANLCKEKTHTKPS